MRLKAETKLKTGILQKPEWSEVSNNMSWCGRSHGQL